MSDTEKSYELVIRDRYVIIGLADADGLYRIPVIRYDIVYSKRMIAPVIEIGNSKIILN